MRILFLDQFGDVAGAQSALLDLLPAIRERGWSAHLAAPSGGLLERAHDSGVAVTPIRCGPYHAGTKTVPDTLRFARDFMRLRREIATLLVTYRPDVLYVNGPRLLPAAAWAARQGPPLLFHCHSFLSARYATLLAGRSLRLARATAIACCRFVAQPLRPYSAAHVIYCGTRDYRAPRHHFTARTRFRVGAIGRIAPQKGQAEFIRAARTVTRSGMDCEFVICGSPLFAEPAYLTDLRALAGGLPVEFLPWQEDISGVLADLDLLVVPSTVPEGTPKVILEAFSAGVPVLAVRSGGIPEIVAHETTGFLVGSPAPDALASALLDVLRRGPDELNRAARTARADWCSRFTLPRYQRAVLELIEQTALRTGSIAA